MAPGDVGVPAVPVSGLALWEEQLSLCEQGKDRQGEMQPPSLPPRAAAVDRGKYADGR